MLPVSPIQAPVVARPKRDFYAIIGVVAFFGVCVLVAAVYATRTSPLPEPPPVWTAFAFVGVLFGLPLAIALWLMRRLRLVADERGLEIRSAFKTQFIAWPEIEDYELRASPDTAATSRLSWICASGKWHRLPTLHDNRDALRARIQIESLQSRAQKWQLNVARDDADNWPKTYAYRDPSGRWSFGLAFAGLLFYFGFAFRGAFSAQGIETVRLVWDNFEGWEHAAFIMPPLLIFAMFSLWLLPMYSVMRAKKRLGRHVIRADTNSLTLLDGETQTRMAWDEITDYFLEDASGPINLHQCAVESPNARVIFRQEISDFAELKALIQTRAIHAKSREWRSRESADSDILGGEQSLWPGGVAGVGRKVYHYRTRSFRALLFLGSSVVLMCVVPLLIAFTSENYANRVGDQIGVPVSMGIIGFVAALGWIAFWRASIQTDENGITHRSIWGERFLRWDEIKSFVFYGHFYAVKSENATIRYGLVAAEQSLRTEIEARTGLKMNRTDRSENEE